MTRRVHVRLAELDAAAHRRLGWCCVCLRSAMDYVIRAQLRPSPCPACGGEWLVPSVLIALHEAYGQRPRALVRTKASGHPDTDQTRRPDGWL